MKILHTADWHLGAKTDRRSRIDEQKMVMQEIVRLADKEAVDIVIISGDIFDQAVCSSEAEDLFYDTLEKLSCDNKRVVVALAGNHDDPKRVLACGAFAKKHKIVLSGNLNPLCDIDTRSHDARVVEVTDGSVLIEKGLFEQQERVVVGLLPYPTDYRLGCELPVDSYSAKIKEWAKIACKGFRKDAFNILASHLTLAGSDYEEGVTFRNVLDSEPGVVKLSDLPVADYYALGHIHSAQTISNKANYPGAPLKLSFIQKTTSVNILTITNNKLEKLEKVKLKTPVKMEKVCANGIEKVAEALQYYSTEDLVELTICQNKPLTSEEIKDIKFKYPAVLTVKLMLSNVEQDDKVYVTNRDKLSAKDLFVDFYKSKYFAEPDPKLVELFIEIMEDKSGETN